MRSTGQIHLGNVDSCVFLSSYGHRTDLVSILNVCSLEDNTSRASQHEPLQPQQEQEKNEKWVRGVEGTDMAEMMFKQLLLERTGSFCESASNSP